MSWECVQLEERLTDYLESCLSPAELAAADAHAQSCARCSEWLDARRAALWLRRVETLETPPGLETRILALTVAPRVAGESFWTALAADWRLVLTPRFGLGLAVGTLSILMILNLFGISIRNVQLADLHPVSLYRAADRKAHQGYAWGVRYVNDLRVVYEIRSSLEEVEEPAETPAAPPEAAPSKPEEKKSKNPAPQGLSRIWLLAAHLPGGGGEWR